MTRQTRLKQLVEAVHVANRSGVTETYERACLALAEYVARNIGSITIASGK